jgi:hypothetical protein
VSVPLVQIDRHERAWRFRRLLKRWTARLVRRLRRRDHEADLRPRFRGYTR